MNKTGTTNKRSTLIFVSGVKDNSAKKAKATIKINEVLSLLVRILI